MTIYQYPQEWQNSFRDPAVMQLRDGDLVPCGIDVTYSHAHAFCENCGGMDGEPGVIIAWRVGAPGQHVSHKWFGDKRVFGNIITAPCPVCAGFQRDIFLRDNSGLRGMMLGMIPALDIRLDTFRKMDGNDEARSMAGRVMADITDRENGRQIRSFCVTGPYGVGKTLLLMALVNSTILARIRARYCTAQGMIQDIMDTFDQNTARRITADVIAEYCRVPILAIDELDRANFNSAWVSTQYFEIVNRRLHSDVLTLFASNKSVKELSYYGDPLSAIASRLSAGLVADICGEDIRPLIGARAMAALEMKGT